MQIKGGVKMRCKSDVFKGDIVKVNGELLVVIDDMSSNNGNYRAKDKCGRMQLCNMLSTEVIKRGTDDIYV